MPRKKSIKQKVSQRVVQNVKVIVTDTGRKRRTAGRRKPRGEPQVETISAKTLAPVFIQPPVLSQPYPFDLSMPPSLASSLAAQRRSIEPQLSTPPSMIEIFEKQKAIAEPLFPSAKELLDDKELIVPVSKSKLPENPTTSIDSNISVQEAYNIFFNQPLKDTNLQSRDNEFGITLADIDKTPTNYELDPIRDMAAIKKNLQFGLQKDKDIELKPIKTKKAYKLRHASNALINDLLLFAKDEALRNMSKDEANDFIAMKREEEKLTYNQFRKKYILSSEKAKQLRDIKKYPIATQTSPLKVGNPLYETIFSPTK